MKSQIESLETEIKVLRIQLYSKVAENIALKERTSSLENITSEAAFKERFELEYVRKQREEVEKLKKENPAAWHKKNVEQLMDQSEQLQQYVKQQFDKKRQLVNCKGQKKPCIG